MDRAINNDKFIEIMVIGTFSDVTDRSRVLQIEGFWIGLVGLVDLN